MYWETHSIYMTVHEKTRYKLKIAILDNVHLKVQTLCYFMLKSDLQNGNKITFVWDNAVLFSACYSSLLILTSSSISIFISSWKNVRIPGFLMQCHILFKSSFIGQLHIYNKIYVLEPLNICVLHVSILGYWGDLIKFTHMKNPSQSRTRVLQAGGISK